MKIGLYLCTQFPPGDDVAARLHDTIEQVRLARRLG